MTREKDRVMHEPNPFSTRFIRAGEMQFQFSHGEPRRALRDRLTQTRWQGQIVGPHGSGKSTLLHTLRTHWSNWGRMPHSFSLHNGQRRLPAIAWRKWTRQTQVIVDGFEQLDWVAKLGLILRCRKQQCGLLVTTHRRTPLLPVVRTNRTSLTLARSLVAELSGNRPLPPCAVDRAFASNEGNLREMFLSLYDEHQAALPFRGAPTARRTETPTSRLAIGQADTNMLLRPAASAHEASKSRLPRR